MMQNGAQNNSHDAKYNIRVLDRAFRVLELLSDGKPRPAQDVSKGIDLNLSTTFRLLSTLCYYDYLQRDEFDQYSLGLACLELARAYQESNDLRKIALVEMEYLRDELKETVHLAVLDKMQVVYIEKLAGLHPIGLLGSRIGGRSPAYCTGVGKVLLAYQDPKKVAAYYETHEFHQFTPNTITDMEKLEENLAEIRRNGYAVDDQEHESQVCCVAAPIYNMDKEVVAALSVSGPDIRMDPIRENIEVIKQVNQTVLNISRHLGYRP
jgi:DNA-binding IclR family transcriptional regulator